MAEFIKPAQFGMATIFGKGQQMVSWIHHHDLCKMMIYGIETASLKGVYNAVSPDPTSNKDLIIAITKITRLLLAYTCAGIYIGNYARRDEH